MKKQIISLLIAMLFISMENTLAVDLDGNGIQDYNEQILANMFCPCIVLDREDGGVSPEPVEIMGTISEKLWMRVFDIRGRFAFEEQVITGQSWDPPISFYHKCLDINRNYSWYYPEYTFTYTGDPGPEGGPGKYFIKLHYEWAGQGNNPSAWRAAYANEASNNTYKDRIYAHLWKKSSSEYIVQYWFFYPFNDCANKHEGDWEHINVWITSQEPSTALIKGIDYYFHHKVIWADVVNHDYFVIDDTHPVVFVGGRIKVLAAGPGSHASYPVLGSWRDIGPLGADEDVHGNGRFIHHTDFDVFVLPHNPDVIDYSKNKKMCWLKANMPWGHMEVYNIGDFVEQLWWIPGVPEDIGNNAPPGPYYCARGLAWSQTGQIYVPQDNKWAFKNYDKNWAYRPVTNSGWNPPSVATPPEPPELNCVNRLGSQVTLGWTNKVGTAGTKIYYSQEPRFDRFYEYNGTGLNEGNSSIVINNPTTNSYTLHGLSGLYYFALRSFNDTGDSWFSNELFSDSFTSTSAGTLSKNETWCGTHTLTGSVTVPSGITLTITPGTTIKFGGYYNLTAKAGGKIIAEGTESNPILFTSATGTSRQSWKNVFVYGSHNRFKWCTFEYGNWALKVEGYPDFATDNVIENCTFHDNDQALRIHKNTATVENCDIYNNRHALVCYNNTYIEFRGDRIYNNDRDGVYSWSGNDLEFFNTVIENNGLGHTSTCNGVYTSYDDLIYFGNCWSGESGCNTIRNNYNHEIYASGDPDLYLFKSSLHDDNGGYEIYAGSSNMFMVHQQSWAGEYPPNFDQFNDELTIIVISSPLESPSPGGSSLLVMAAPSENVPIWEGETTGEGLGKIIANDGHPSGWPPPRNKERIRQLKEIIKAEKSKLETKAALHELYSIIRADFVKDELGEKKNFYGYLDKIFNSHRAKRLGKIALQKMIVWKMLENDNDNAIKLSRQALKILSGEDRMSVLENLAMLYIDRGQINKAKACLDECKEKYSFDKAGIEMVEEELEDAESQIKEGILKPDISDEEFTQNSTSTPVSFNLSQNYPNPGNPTTTISFQLPESRHVVLKIFNVLGQEVKTLVNDYREAGTYSVIWDGRDNRGTEVPSGIYLYTLRVGDKVFTKKLTLLK